MGKASILPSRLPLRWGQRESKRDGRVKPSLLGWRSEPGSFAVGFPCKSSPIRALCTHGYVRSAVQLLKTAHLLLCLTLSRRCARPHFDPQAASTSRWMRRSSTRRSCRSARLSRSSCRWTTSQVRVKLCERKIPFVLFERLSSGPPVTGRFQSALVGACRLNCIPRRFPDTSMRVFFTRAVHYRLARISSRVQARRLHADSLSCACTHTTDEHRGFALVGFITRHLMFGGF